MTPEERASQSIVMLIASVAADTSGANYSPCFRDCLHDARGWVGPIIAVAIRKASARAAVEAFEEAAAVAKTYRERYQSQGDAEANIAAVMAEEIEAAIREKAKG